MNSDKQAVVAVTKYLDELGRVNEANKSGTRYDDTVHGINGLNLKCSDLRTILDTIAERDAEIALLKEYSEVDTQIDVSMSSRAIVAESNFATFRYCITRLRDFAKEGTLSPEDLVDRLETALALTESI